MEFWKTPEVREAEREFAEMAEELETEVSLFVLVTSEPTGAIVPPIVSLPHLLASFVPVSVLVAQEVSSDSLL